MHNSIALKIFFIAAKKAIVTFSLGVLQSNSVKFKPELPDWKQEAIHGVRT